MVWAWNVWSKPRVWQFSMGNLPVQFTRISILKTRARRMLFNKWGHLYTSCSNHTQKLKSANVLYSGNLSLHLKYSMVLSLNNGSPPNPPKTSQNSRSQLCRRSELGDAVLPLFPFSSSESITKQGDAGRMSPRARSWPTNPHFFARKHNSGGSKLTASAKILRKHQLTGPEKSCCRRPVNAKASAASAKNI